MKNLKVVLILLFTCLTSVAANATEVHVWDKKPIEIQLEVGKERIIFFPSNVKFGMSPDFRSKIKLSNAAGTVYIKPMQAFNKTRVFGTLDNGERLVLDFFSVRPQGNDVPEDFKIVHPAQVKEASESLGTQSTEAEAVAVGGSSKAVTIKDLLQYANIDLYGPARLLPNLPITEKKVTKPLNLKHVFINRSAGLFELEAFKQYQSMNYTVTAIHLRNKTSRRQYINLTDVYPAMLVDSSHHSFVEARTSDPSQRDSTTFFIVTNKPLSDYSFYAPTVAGLHQVQGSENE
ncbi:DUF3438 family protein [Vibrio sp. Y2-5]|uniref:DUF3438 family protein n=1 Tax=Vibrio sp. Y2-5 TaxID=2743977 RepID=UPI00166115E4|nr:DUF3438 family protein [Vibrio sp. Y2-5]MBD0788035.1 DUF3438 family protein [Vibrio sp. Y2-5]